MGPSGIIILGKSCYQSLARLFMTRHTMLVTEQGFPMLHILARLAGKLTLCFKNEVQRDEESCSRLHIAGKWRNQDISPDLLAPFTHI